MSQKPAQQELLLKADCQNNQCYFRAAVGDAAVAAARFGAAVGAVGGAKLLLLLPDLSQVGFLGVEACGRPLQFYVSIMLIEVSLTCGCGRV